MYGDRVSGGYEAGFVFTEQQAALVRAKLDETTWQRRYVVRPRYDVPSVRYENMGKVRAKVRPATGFAGVKGFAVVAQTKGEMDAVQRAVEAPMYDLFKGGETVRLVLNVRRFGTGEDFPKGTKATVKQVYSGALDVVWEDGTETSAPWQWFEVT